MSNPLKIVFTICFVTVLVVGWYAWIFFGNPYPRLSLLGTEYIHKDSDHKNDNEAFTIEMINQAYQEDIYLIKKYKYSKDVWLLGFGGASGSSQTNDYYAYGIADKKKETIIPVKYEAIVVDQDFKLNKTYLRCMPFGKTDTNPIIYEIRRGQFIQTENR